MRQQKDETEDDISQQFILTVLRLYLEANYKEFSRTENITCLTTLRIEIFLIKPLISV